MRSRGSARIRCGSAAALLLLASSVLASSAARAQDWPSRPVVLVVPYDAGGIVDIAARLLAEHFGKTLPQPIVVENRSGAGGTIATQYVARAKPDGHTLLVGSVAQLAIAPLIQEVKYDPIADFAPISMFSSGAIGLAVHADVAAKSTAEIVALGKAEPGKLAYSSAGFGSFSHLGGAALAAQAQIELLHVPYKGAVPAVQALLTGQAQVYVGNLAELVPLLPTARIRLLATATRARMATSPEVPTIAETLPGFEMEGWQALVAPAQTPAPILQRLEQEAIAAARLPATVARLRGISANAVGSSAAELAASLGADLARYRVATRAAGMRR